MSYSIMILEHDGKTGPKGFRPIHPELMYAPGDECRGGRKWTHVLAQEHNKWLAPFGHPRVNCVVTIHPKDSLHGL